MEAPLALYEALIQANAPTALARDAAEKLERDMNIALAIRQDLQQLDTKVQLLDAKVDSLRQEMDSRFKEMDSRLESRFAVIDERFVSLEQRIVIKLGVLMTVLIGTASGLQVLLS